MDQIWLICVLTLIHLLEEHIHLLHISYIQVADFMPLNQYELLKVLQIQQLIPIALVNIFG